MPKSVIKSRIGCRSLYAERACDDLPPEGFTSLGRSPIVPQSVYSQPRSCPDVNTTQSVYVNKLLQLWVAERPPYVTHHPRRRAAGIYTTAAPFDPLHPARR